MDTNAIIYLISTLFTISFFSLWILRKISVVHSVTKEVIESLSDRIDLVENTLLLIKNTRIEAEDIEAETVDDTPEIE